MLFTLDLAEGQAENRWSTETADVSSFVLWLDNSGLLEAEDGRSSAPPSPSAPRGPGPPGGARGVSERQEVVED